MSIADKLTAVAENQQKIATRYFKTSFTGDGTKKASFAIPFMPDLVLITSVSPYILTAAGVFAELSLDTRSAFQYAGKLAYPAQAGAISQALLKTSSVMNAISYENGVFAWELAAVPAVWSPLARYSVTAAKFPNDTTRDLVEEEIALLPDTVPSGSNGTVVYNAARINEVFTSDEWATLTGQKPNWTFSMV